MAFNETFNVGRVGEEIIMYYFINKGYKVIDRRQDEEYQNKDIDFEYYKEEGKIWSVEVKTDRRISQTGNVVIEIGMDRQTGFYKGWYYKCEADCVCFYDIKYNKAYFINWKKLKEYIADYKIKERSFHNKIDDCTGYLYIISIQELRKNNLLYKELNL